MAEKLIRGFWAAFEKDAVSDLESFLPLITFGILLRLT